MSTVFFFQAEDGIRDYKVTGVQTCALPICQNHFRQLNLTDAVIQSRAQLGHFWVFVLCGQWRQMEFIIHAQYATAGCSGHRIDTDRKSTRLNSSHLVISYAVFCLKKKDSSSPSSPDTTSRSC